MSAPPLGLCPARDVPALAPTWGPAQHAADNVCSAPTCTTPRGAISAPFRRQPLRERIAHIVTRQSKLVAP